MMINKYFYIYNIKQADFFVKNNLQPVGVGKGRTKAVYLKFIRNEEAENVFSKWCYIQNLIQRRTDINETYEHR